MMMRRMLFWLTLTGPVVILAVVLAVGLAQFLPIRPPVYAVRIDLPDVSARIGLPAIEGAQGADRPLILIDAGHGGHDPGASGSGQVEKNLALALARDVRDRLVAAGGIRVALTRNDDSFLVLEERADLARRMGADLFLSIHADAADNQNAQGATIYTLSRDASDREAAQFAARENRADRVNGTSLAGTSDDVSQILVELSQRRMQDESGRFGQLVLREAAGMFDFHGRAQRSASFVVLKSPDVPSVLFEAGYISNEYDAALIASPEGRAKFAEVLARAVRIYFARRDRI